MQNIQKHDGNIKADRTPFLKLYTDDWIAGTIELSFEEKGFYFEVLLRMWDRKGTLPDDANWLACALGCNPRTVRKLVTRLVATDHLQVANGVVSNRRMMREISQNVTRTHKQHDQSSANPSPIEPELASNSSGTMAKTSTISTRVLLPETRSQNPEPQVKIQASTSLEAVVPAGDITDEMIKNLWKWQTLPEPNAREWLGSFVREFGQDVVISSYNKTIRDIAQKKMIAKPIAYWSRIANDMKADASLKKTAGTVPEKLESRKIIERKMALHSETVAAHG